jgi:hypothetical protein
MFLYVAYFAVQLTSSRGVTQDADADQRDGAGDVKVEDAPEA